MARLLTRLPGAVIADDGASAGSTSTPDTPTAPRAARPVRARAARARSTGSRTTHPVAWWGWALAVGAAVSLSTNPLLVVLVLAGLVLVVAARRTDDPWARTAGTYITIGVSILVIRMVFQIVLGGSSTGTVLFTLPQLTLPGWAAGVRLGGPVSAEGLAATGYDALRLAAMLACFGAANTLANPRRVLKAVPAALHDVSVAVVIALSVFPQLIVSVGRVRRARRLRGGRTRGWRAITGILIPVLQDAVEASMSLARAMESRGFGRTRDNRRVRPGTAVELAVSMAALTIGVYLVLADPQWASAPRLSGQLLGILVLAAGTVGTVAGLRSSGRRLRVTRYRPDRWNWRSPAVVTCGLGAATASIALGRLAPTALNPPTSPLTWPTLNPLMLLAAVLVAAPLLLTRPPHRAAALPGGPA